MKKSPTPNALTTLLAECERPEFTPGKKSFPVLAQAFAISDDSMHKAVARAFLKTGESGEKWLERELEKSEAPAKARVAKALMRFAADNVGESRLRMRELLKDPDEQTRRVAIQAVGQWLDISPEEEAELESALLGLWADESLPTHRSIARSLGRLGGEKSLNFLSELKTKDKELIRISASALVELNRRLTRDEGSVIDSKYTIGPVSIIAFSKPGLEGFVQEELARYMPKKFRSGQVQFNFQGRLEDLFVSRVMTHFAIEAPAQVIGQAGAGEALARAIAVESVQTLLKSLTKGKVRYRIEWAGSGKLRSQTDACAKMLMSLCPEMVNDPSERVWEVEGRVQGRKLSVLLRPHIEDTRFEWRVADVPAASHPTVAAALVQLAGVNKHDSVWDPFVGSAMELVERGLAGQAKRLVGTDNDAEALEAARQNLESAGVEAELVLAKAQSFKVGKVDCILTNPPLGWRVSDDKGIKALFEKFLPHAASCLNPGGRLIWMTRHPKVTDVLAKKAGFRITYSEAVDLGGLTASMQRLVRT